MGAPEEVKGEVVSLPHLKYECSYADLCPKTVDHYINDCGNESVHDSVSDHVDHYLNAYLNH